jgi:hypothetical protein
VLTITPQALTVMRQVTAHPALKSSSGIRIGRRPGRTALQVRTVEEPEPGDTVLEERGARLYLGPDVDRQVARGELDVATDTDGRVHFILRTPA